MTDILRGLAPHVRRRKSLEARALSILKVLLRSDERKALLRFAHQGRGFDDRGLRRSIPLQTALEKLRKLLEAESP